MKGLRRTISCPWETLEWLEVCNTVDGPLWAGRGSIYFRCKNHVDIILDLLRLMCTRWKEVSVQSWQYKQTPVEYRRKNVFAQGQNAFRFTENFTWKLPTSWTAINILITTCTIIIDFKNNVYVIPVSSVPKIKAVDFCTEFTDYLENMCVCFFNSFVKLYFLSQSFYTRIGLWY